MVDEQSQILEAVRIAIQMEIDGKEFYLKASQASGNELGKELLQKLAAQEDFHRQKFVKIYDDIRNKKAWPVIVLQPEAGKGLGSIFATATKEMVSRTKALKTELEAIEKAMEMENKSYDLYKGRAKKTTSDTEKNFYEALAAEEREHHTILLDYHEYLKDPAGWFVRKEHPSLDGS